MNQLDGYPKSRRFAIAVAGLGLVAGSMISSVAPVSAQPGCTPAACPTTDLDFANQLHTFGIYGQRDYNAWIAKITCKRLYTGLDADAYESHEFVADQLDRGSTEVQAWQFLGTALRFYCPDQTGVLGAVGRPS